MRRMLIAIVLSVMLLLVPNVAAEASSRPHRHRAHHHRVHHPRTQRSPSVVSVNVWDRLAQCESGGNWHLRDSSPYTGGLQFDRGTWHGVGGTGVAADASREEQIARAEVLRSRRGYQPWPACSRRLGLR